MMLGSLLKAPRFLVCKKTLVRSLATQSATKSADVQPLPSSTDIFRQVLKTKQEHKVTRKIKYSVKVRSYIKEGVKARGLDLESEEAKKILTPQGGLKYMTKKALWNATSNDLKRATATIKKIKGSPYKLALLCNQVRGLSYTEAVAQMQFSHKKLAWYVKRALNSARYNAENTFNLNPDRLIVENIWAGKATYLRRVMFKGKGRTSRMEHPFCKVFVALKEIPHKDNERRFGKFGKTNKLVEKEGRRANNIITAEDFLNSDPSPSKPAATASL